MIFEYKVRHRKVWKGNHLQLVKLVDATINSGIFAFRLTWQIYELQPVRVTRQAQRLFSDSVLPSYWQKCQTVYGISFAFFSATLIWSS